MNKEQPLPLSLLKLPAKEDRPALWAFMMSDKTIGLYDPKQDCWEGGFKEEFIAYDEAWFDNSDTISSLAIISYFDAFRRVIGVAKAEGFTFAIKHEESGKVYDWFLYELFGNGSVTEHRVALMPSEEFGKCYADYGIYDEEDEEDEEDEPFEEDDDL